MRIPLSLILVFVLPLALGQCVLTNTDPGYTALLRVAERNPSPNAIVGMWHREDHRMMLKESTTSYLFKSDGTLHVIGQAVMLGAVGESPRNVLRYRYLGQGVWSIVGSDVTLRISQGKLLFRLPVPQYNDFIHYVFERQG
ncbi:MAG: hypothetical protein KDK97_04095 [Verrucomicrobiales bacterium]|nr:hypothetical protein [Verrucomicrobiales bacterium]MCP5557976.1 hypothetical protein [Verrucomicrobiaceae bacterium]